jgi:ubiquitin carboxyl-terminal hydrolase 9/24
MTVSGPSSRSDGEEGGSPNRNVVVTNPGSPQPNTVQPPTVSPNSQQRRQVPPTEASDCTLVDTDTLIENFPLAKLQKLDELISNPRWVIPVLPKGELEVLLDYSIRLTRAGGADKNCEPCQRFYREGLLISFTKIMTDEAVSSWRYDIQVINCF